MDYSPPDFSVYGIFQAWILEWVAIYYSKESSQLRDQTCVSCIGSQILHHWATWEAPYTQNNSPQICTYPVCYVLKEKDTLKFIFKFNFS